MKKMLSLLLSSAMLISTLPVMAQETTTADVYFTDTITVNYSKSYTQGLKAEYATEEEASKYTFTTVVNATDNETFALLDAVDDENSKYLMTTTKTYATRNLFKETEVTNYFRMPETDEEKALEINEKDAKFPSWGMNGDFFKNAWAHTAASGVTVRISNTVRKYIDMNHTWNVEPALNAKIPNDAYSYTAGIVYPSASEIEAYSKRFLVKDSGDIITRTMLDNSDLTERRLVRANASNEGKCEFVGEKIPQGGLPVRPMFWTNKDFFANVKIDLSTAGAAVLQEVKKVKVSKLEKMYTHEELKTYLGLDAAYFTEERTVDYSQPREQNNSAPFGIETEAYSFTTKNGDYLSLLDVKNDDNSKYFIMTSKGYAGFGTTKNDNANYFAMPANGETGDVAAASYPSWSINSNYFKLGYYFKITEDWAGVQDVRLADDVRSCIDFTHVWNVEPTPNAHIPNTAYSYTAGIAYPSVSELLTYADRFAKKNTANEHDYNIFTRTFVNNASYSTSGQRYIGVLNLYDSGNTGKAIVGGWKDSEMTNAPVRPCFWANKDFFKTVKVNLSTAGAAVKQEIKKVELEKLLELYTVDEVKNQLGMEIPTDAAGLYSVRVKTRSGNDPKYGETLIAGYDFISDYAMKSVSITWKKDVDGTVTTLGTGDTYIVTEEDAATGKEKIYFDITVTSKLGDEYSKTSGKETIPSLGVTPKDPNCTIAGIKKNADSADTFKVDGKTFTLLDSFDNDKSTFFVTVNDSYGSYTVSSVWSDPDTIGNYAYWMNNTFKKNGNGDNKLPEDIINYIDFDHIWLTEGAPNSPAADTFWDLKNDNYALKAGIAPLSVSEIERYKNVLGSNDGTGYFYTRTTANFKNGTATTTYIANAKTGTSGDTNAESIWMPPWDIPSSNNIKPAFYLTKDFFKNVEVDFDEMGANVLKAMQETYSIEDLTDLYTEKYLTKLGFKNKAKATVTYSTYGNSSNVLNELNGAESLQANVSLETAAAGIDATAILALYDGTDKLVKVATANLKSDTTTATATVGFEALSGIGIQYYTKLMIWDDMEPLTKEDIFSSDYDLELASEAKITSQTEGNNFF